jgi:xylose isomerase
VANDLLGSIDANRGDLLLGWDTDQFPLDLYDCALAMYTVLRGGGFTSGGLNFDAKLRRQSTDRRSTCSAPTSARWTRSPAG